MIPLSAPGIYSGIPIGVYHGPSLCERPSVSSSALRKIIGKGPKKSPAHYWASSPYNPKAAARIDSEAFVLGRAAHHLLLGERDFAKQFVVRPLRWDSWRTDAAKAWRQEQTDFGITVLDPKQLDTIKGMSEALSRNSLVQQGALNGKIEQTLVCPSEVEGIWLKARPDVIPTDDGNFVDFKTTASVDTEALRSAIGEYGYHMQGAMVAEVYQAVTGREMETFSLVFVEKDPPHCVRVVTLRPHDLDRGRQLNRVALQKFAHGMATGDWPGPGEGEEFVSPSDWTVRNEDEIIARWDAEKHANGTDPQS